MLPAPFAAWDASRHRIALLVGEVARHDGDRNGKLAGVLADAGDEGSRPRLAGRGRMPQDGDVLVVLAEIDDLLRVLSRADHALRHDAGNAAGARGVPIEHRVGLLVGFRAHDVGDPEPLLIAVMRLDHAQHQHGRADAQRAPAGEIERAIAFRRVVDDDHEFRRVTGLVAAALLAHRYPGPMRNPAMPFGCGTSPHRATTVASGRIAVGLEAFAAANRFAAKQCYYQRRTKPTISFTAFMVSAAMTCARAAPSASTESM